MATFRSVLKATLEGDATFAGLIDHILDASDLPPEGLTPGQDPDIWDGYGAIEPTAVIRVRGPKPYGPHYEAGSEREFAEIYLYHDSSVAVLESAMNRLKDLLDRAFLSVDGKRVRLKWAGDQGDLRADEVGGAHSMMFRVEAVKFR